MKKKLWLIPIALLVLSTGSTLVSGPSTDVISLTSPTVEVFNGGRQYAFMFSWDDEGDDLDFSFLEDEVGFRHTTFGVTRRLFQKKLWALDQLFRGHDIQSHSREHLHHAELNSSYREYLISQSFLDIDKLLGYKPILFAYPYGSQNIECQRQVLKYFKLARGIRYETGSNVGTWPIAEFGNSLHSYPSIDGVCGANMHRLVAAFEAMISESNGENRAFKCYGHSRWFTDEEKTEFFKMLQAIAFREDTWYTSWGEAVAYQLERDSILIRGWSFDGQEVSFETHIEEEFEFGVPLTYKVEIPPSWDSVVVLDGGRITDQFKIITDADERFVIMDSSPSSQRVRIQQGDVKDYSGPVIRNMRTILTDRGVAFLADVEDSSSLISDVNITVKGGGQVHEFQKVLNPIFWANSTYGRVVFDIAPGCYWFEFRAIDSSGNIATRGACFCC